MDRACRPPTPLAATFDHVRGLDGLRAVAVLLVLVAHFGWLHVVPGGLGVTIFFFISGLLITRLLLAEIRLTGTIHLRNFYIRRAIRLYPTMLLGTLVCVVIFYLIGAHVSGAEILSAIFYVANYYDNYFRYGSHSGAPSYVTMHPLGVFWSLAVEEQYYLAFPLLVKALRRNTVALWWVVLALLIVTLAWRIHLYDPAVNIVRYYQSTDTRVDSILWGAFLAITLTLPAGTRVMPVLQHPMVVSGALLTLVATLLFRSEEFRQTYRYTLQGLALFPLVATLCFGDRFAVAANVMEWRWLRLIGAWSYALYVFHPSAIVVAEYFTKTSYLSGPAQLGPTWYAIAVPMTMFLALGCYYWVERPMQSLRARFGSHRRDNP